MADDGIDVIIWTFRIGGLRNANPNSFAYCRVENGRVVEVVEKRTISDNPSNDPAVVGSFTYKRAGLFLEGARQMIQKDVRVNGEYYVGTSINQLIEAGYKVCTFDVDQFVSFGTPEELRVFEYWEEFFSSEMDHPYAVNRGWKGPQLS